MNECVLCSVAGDASYALFKDESRFVIKNFRTGATVLKDDESDTMDQAIRYAEEQGFEFD